MKKNLLIGAMLLGAASFSMLTGFDSALTAEDVTAKMQEASANVNEVNGKADINFDASLSVPAADITMGLTAGGTENVSAVMDPLACAVDGEFTVSIMGQEMKAAVTAYGVMEDGKFAVYSNAEMEGEESAGWTKTSTDAAPITEMLNQLKGAPVALPFNFDLASAPIELNGKECYELSAVVPWNDVYLVAQSYLEQVAGADTASQLEAYGSLLSGLNITMTIYVNTESFLPEYVHVDLNDSDWSAIGALVSSMFGTDENGNPFEVELKVNATDIDVTYDYSTAVEIVLPEEAKSAQEVAPDTLLELVENADDAA